MAAVSESKLSADELNRARTNHERNHVFCMGVERDREGLWRLPQNKIGQGLYGKIYEICTRDNKCDYVMKIVRLGDYSVSKAQFKNEVALQKEAHKLKVAPLIVDDWICQKPSIGVIIMPTLKRTLKDILQSKKTTENTKQKRIAEAQSLLKKLQEASFRHNDIHLNNFMEGFDGKLYLIDYGQASSKTTTPDKWKPTQKNAKPEYQRVKDLTNDFLEKLPRSKISKVKSFTSTKTKVPFIFPFSFFFRN